MNGTDKLHPMIFYATVRPRITAESILRQRRVSLVTGLNVDTSLIDAMVEEGVICADDADRITRQERGLEQNRELLCILPSCSLEQIVTFIGLLRHTERFVPYALLVKSLNRQAWKRFADGRSFTPKGVIGTQTILQPSSVQAVTLLDITQPACNDVTRHNKT